MPKQFPGVNDAVRELASMSAIRRRDLLVVADKHGAPFKTVVQRLEREAIIPVGTYNEIISRFKSVRYFRARVLAADDDA